MSGDWARKRLLKIQMSLGTDGSIRLPQHIGGYGWNIVSMRLAWATEVIWVNLGCITSFYFKKRRRGECPGMSRGIEDESREYEGHRNTLEKFELYIICNMKWKWTHQM